MTTTNQTTKRFPDGFRMILYIAAVATLGFLNCCMLRAGDPEKDADYTTRLEAALIVDAEPEIELEDWILNFNPGFPVKIEDEDIVLENWMLNLNHDFLVELEDEAIILEDWMLDPGYYVVETLFIAKNK